MLPGCAAPAPAPPPLVIHSEPWDAQHPESRCLVTPHYRIYTDLRDPEDHRNIAAVMENAHLQYQHILPAEGTQELMRCFVFSRRAEWAEFTARNTGTDAAVYLKINRGAYSIDDWFVAFWLGDRGTFSVVAHEGWHQYVARHSKGRMPPALEEGFACRFENIDFRDGAPEFKQRTSRSRERAVGRALAQKRLWPISELLRLHAGEVIRLPSDQIETFYAQTWALSLFLMDNYPVEMRRYFADLQQGMAWRPAVFTSLKPSEWHPKLSQPQLEHYIQRPLSSIETPFIEYCRKLSSSSRDEG